MHLAFAIFKYFPHGGLQSDMLRIAEAAAVRNHQVNIFTSAWEGKKPANPNIKIIILPLKCLTNWGKAAEFEKKFLQIISTENFDLKVAFNRISGSDFYFAADNCLLSLFNKPCSFLTKQLNPRYRVYLRQEESIFAKNLHKPALLYIAETQKEAFIEAYNTAEKRFLYLPPGMNIACKRPDNAEQIRKKMRTELALSEEELMLIQVGPLTTGKGCDRTILALAELPDKIKCKVKLFFAGGGKEKHLSALINKNKLQGQVKFLGIRNDVPDLLQAADIMIHPARNEAAGSVLLEGIAAGVPVICSGECGFYTFVEEAAGLVTKKPFEQNELNQLLLKTINKLPELTEQTRDYAENADFYSRAEKAVDYFEEAVNYNA